MRKISLGKDAQGHTRIFLNNKFLFQVGALDQGYWPDGIYTAPTDAALRYDIETAKQLGFNLLRKHAKVEPDRWYYWTDKLGMLVWQDMPQAFGRPDRRGQSAVGPEWASEIAEFYNTRPSSSGRRSTRAGASTTPSASSPDTRRWTRRDWSTTPAAGRTRASATSPTRTPTPAPGPASRSRRGRRSTASSAASP